MTTKIAVIGEREFILPFKGLGLEIFPVETWEEAKNIVLGLELEGYGIIFITEDFAVEMQETFADFRGKALPTLIPIPASHGSTGFAQEEMKNYTRKALGWDILSAD